MRLEPQTRSLLEQMRASGAPPLCDLPVAQARAALAQMSSTLDLELTEVAEVQDTRIPVPGGTIPVRVYRPFASDQALGLLILFHGGGFMVGDLDTHDRMARFYARQTGAVVVSVGYRLAPEHRFPVGVEDCYAALVWAAAHAAGLGADPGRIAVTGDSAGANLAAVMAVLARERGGPAIAFQALVYPAVDLDPQADYPSRRLYAEDYFLTARDVAWVTANYFDDAAAQCPDPRASPIRAPDLAGLPPALVVTAGFDPLRDEGRAFAERLAAAGVSVEYRCFEETIHGFFSFAGVLDAGREGLALVAARVRLALQQPS